MHARERYEGSYGLAVAIVLLGLCPNIVLAIAFVPLAGTIAHDLGTSEGTLALAGALSNAGYAFGAVAAAQLAQRYLQRNLFLCYEAMFVVGSVLAAVAPSVELFIAGRVLEGAATGFMLISALPPLVTRFGVDRLPGTVVIVNIGLFGASAVGPLIGGVAAQTGAWRAMLGIAAALGAIGFAVAAVGYVHLVPPDPERRFDRPALGLALASTVLPFFAAATVAAVGFASPLFLAPFLVGLAALVLLIVLQYRKPDALMPVEALSTQLPVTGILVAMIAGAAFVTVVELVQTFLATVAGQGPIAAAVQFWPMPVGLLVAAAAFGALFRTRWLPVLVNVGLVALAGGSGVLLLLGAGSTGEVVSGASFLLGFGAGATVSPGLFLASFGVTSDKLARAFALVELLRSEAAYAVAPIVLYVATSRPTLAGGVRIGLAAMTALSLAGLGAALAIPALSGARLRRPDLEGWLNEGRQALASPRTVVHVRPRAVDEVAAPFVPDGVRNQRHVQRLRERRLRRRRAGSDDEWNETSR
ncbi:MAG TPA: MFS transporter [Nocardioidaceae bacterium]|nr:MFS transporter [Nocardioidaceae bacterium]